MEGMNGPIALLILVFFMTPLLFYTFARRGKKVYKHGKRKYYTLSNKLLRLKEHVSMEADRWPMYARPVLFTEIDHSAQIEFAKAHQALIDADQILPQIETIEEPETLEQFRFNDLFNVRKNLKTISLGSRLAGSVNELEQNIVNLGDALKSLRTNRQQVENKRLVVEKSIQDLKIRTEQINKRLKPLDVWKSIEAHNFSWVVSNADRCQLEASNSVVSLSENEQGYIEHATADIFVNIGNFSLDCIELFLESQAISRRYELDTFYKLFNESTGFLQSILEMDEVWSGWRKLKRVKPHIDKLPQTRQEAEKSLRSFKNRQDHFERLIALVSGIDIETEIEVADTLEKECTYYWYSYVERKTHWEKALGTPIKFPSTELNRFQTLLVTEINPDIDVDTVIKQSHILGLIMKVGRALEWHNTIDILTLQLETELSVHKDAQKIVNRLLDSQGEATLILGELQLALVDTSPDITDWGIILVNDYQSYLERAKRVRGADFPELQNSLNQFIVDSKRLVKEHNSQLKELEADYNALYKYIDSLNIELERYINHIPRFDKDSVRMFGDAFNESFLILEKKKIEKYSWLRPAVNKMQAWTEKTDSFITPAQNKYQAFIEGKRQVEKVLEQTKEEIDSKKAYVEQKWGWYKSEILPRINALTRSFNREKKEWERLIERNWAEYNINRAISKCENLIQFCEGALIELTQAIEKVNHKQNQLDGKSEAVMLLLQKNRSKLPQQDQYDIRSLVTIAKQYPDYEFANRLLGYAHTMAMRRATAQVRNEIKKIINIKIEGDVKNSTIIAGDRNKIKR